MCCGCHTYQRLISTVWLDFNHKLFPLPSHQTLAQNLFLGLKVFTSVSRWQPVVWSKFADAASIITSIIALMMEVVIMVETSENIYQNTQRNIPALMRCDALESTRVSCLPNEMIPVRDTSRTKDKLSQRITAVKSASRSV